MSTPTPDFCVPGTYSAAPAATSHVIGQAAQAYHERSSYPGEVTEAYSALHAQADSGVGHHALIVWNCLHWRTHEPARIVGTRRGTWYRVTLHYGDVRYAEVRDPLDHLGGVVWHETTPWGA